jgi:hypothetical protein
LKTYIKKYDLYLNSNDDISKLLKNNIEYYKEIYTKFKYIPYVKPYDEKKLIQTQLFNNDIDFSSLISFICNYLKYEKKVNDFSPELVKYYLIKRPLQNFNIFTITRYINSLHYIILFNQTNAKNILNKNKDNKKILTYNNILNNDDIIKTNNNQYLKHKNKKRSLSFDDNKSFNIKKLNTFYSLKKKIGENKNNYFNFKNYTYDDMHEYNMMNKGNNDHLINKEIVGQIYEDLNNNKKYMKRRSVNYEKVKTFTIKRHLAQNSSCNINNAAFGIIKTPNNSLIKKKFIYMIKKKN